MGTYLRCPTSHPRQPPSLPRSGTACAVYPACPQAVADWATRAEVPVAEYTRSWVRQVLDSGPDAPGAQTRAGRAVVEMFESGFQAPVLVLLGAWAQCACGRGAAAGRN